MSQGLGGCALVIAGHGSLKNPNTRKPVCQAVSRIRATGLFDEVVCGLWKEKPYFKEVLKRLRSHQVVIAPMFMSEGYYTRVVLPREFGLSGERSWVEGKVVRLSRALGTHCRMAELIMHRANENKPPFPETLILLGHGTPKNPESSATTEMQAERVRKDGGFPEVLTAYIDQEPFIRDILSSARFEHVVIVPFFVADGWHVTETVPQDLGVECGHATFCGKQLRYTGAVGTDEQLYRVILELAGHSPGSATPGAG